MADRHWTSAEQKVINKLQTISKVRLFQDLNEATVEEFGEKVYEVISAHSRATNILNYVLKHKQLAEHKYEDKKSILKIGREVLLREHKEIRLKHTKREKEDMADYLMRGEVRELDELKMALSKLKALEEMARNIVKDCEIRKQGSTQQIKLFCNLHNISWSGGEFSN